MPRDGKSGLVEFASHTNDCHIRPDAPGIERKSGEDEETYISRISADLQTSITRIELETGQNVTTFTYPLGKMELWAEPFLQQHFAVTLSGVYGTARYGDSTTCRATTSQIFIPPASTSPPLDRQSRASYTKSEHFPNKER